MDAMHSASRPLPWYRRWWFYLIVTCVVAVLGYIVRSEYVKWAARQELEQLLAQLDRTEPHWNLRTWYQSHATPPEEENLALQGLKLLQGFPPESPRFVTLFQERDQYPGNPLNAEQLKELRAMLAAGGDLKAGVQRLLGLKSGHFPPLDLENPKLKIIAVNLNPQQRIRYTATLLGYQAELWAHEGRGEDALETCRCMLHLAHALDNDPFLISHLIAIGIQGHAVTTLERVLAQAKPSGEELVKLQEACWREAEYSFAERAARADRAGLDRLLIEIEQGRYSRSELLQMNPGRPPASVFENIVGGVREWLQGSRFDYIPLERVRNLKFFEEVLSLIRSPEPGGFSKLREVHHRYSLQSPAGIPLAAAIIKTYESDCRRKARLRAAAAVLAAERFQRAAGKNAEGWNDIVPKFLSSIPTDPFDGTPLVWKKTATGFRIESLWVGGNTKIDPNSERKGNGVEYWDLKHRGKLSPVPLPGDFDSKSKEP